MPGGGGPPRPIPGGGPPIPGGGPPIPGGGPVPASTNARKVREGGKRRQEVGRACNMRILVSEEAELGIATQPRCSGLASLPNIGAHAY